MESLALHSVARAEGGALMIEVLVTIAIIILGLAGLMQMQASLQKSEVESYQRTQAIMLLNDMSNRIQSNRPNAGDYLTTGLSPSFMGGDTTELDCSGIGTSDLQQTDFTEWCNALQGAGEALGGSNVGAMVGGRGCVEQIGPSTQGLFMVTVVWQGLTPISAPPASVACGLDSPNPYDGDPASGSTCINDLCRRYVTAMVRIRELPTL